MRLGPEPKATRGFMGWLGSGRGEKQVHLKELTQKVPAGLRHVDIDRMLELSSATGTNGNEPCYGVLDFTGMKAARNHPAEDERARMVQLATRRSS